MLTASASGLYVFAAQCPTPPILYLRFTASLAVAAQDSRPSGSLLLSWHGAEEQRVTSGGRTEFLGGTRISRPISESEMASDTRSVDGRLCSTTSAAKAVRPAMATGGGSGKAAGEDGGEEKGCQMSKGEKVEQFHE